MIIQNDRKLFKHKMKLLAHDVKVCVDITDH